METDRSAALETTIAKAAQTAAQKEGAGLRVVDEKAYKAGLRLMAEDMP